MKSAVLSLIMVVVLCSVVPAQDEDDSSQDGWQTGVSVGAVNINGETFQQLSLRPDIPIGKFGIGLDITLYFDSEGNLRREGWDEAGDLVDKIYYIRYGHKGDPVYLRAGALDNVRLGYGLLMKRYANTVEYPEIKRVGLEWDLRPGRWGCEGMFNNFRELREPGLVAARVDYALIGALRAGVGLVMDGNQYAGIRDRDDDGVPDELDRFDDADDQEVVDDLADLYAYDPDLYATLRDIYGWPAPAALQDPVPDYSDKKASVTAFSVDLAYPFLEGKLLLYGQFAKFLDWGQGFGAPGVRWQPLPMLTLGAEYRDYGDQFIPEYFNRTYELERYTTGHEVNAQGDTVLVLVPKDKAQLRAARAASGIYADADFSFFGWLNLYAAFSTMKPKEGGERGNSLFGRAALNTAKIPKISELSAFYQQANVKSLFELETESTVYGYRLGYEITGGANVYLGYRYSFRDLDGDGRFRGPQERLRTFTIETAFMIP